MIAYKHIFNIQLFLIIVILLSSSEIKSQNTNIMPDSSITNDLNITKSKDSTKVIVKKKSNNQKIDDPINYTSTDSVYFDIANKKVFLYGNAIVKYKDINLEAEYIELDLENNIVFAEGKPDSSGMLKGNPHFKQGNEEYDAKKIRYNFKTKKGIISGVITEQSGGYLHSERTKRLANGDICIKDGKFTTCDLEHPHYYIDLTKAKVIPNEKIVSGPAYLVIEDVPLPIGIPFGFFPDNKKHSSGIIIPEYGEEENRGFFLKQGGYYLALNDYVHFKLLGDIYSHGSWGTSLNSQYKKRYKFTGNFNVAYQSIKILDNDIPKNTYWLNWTHQQDAKAHPSSTFSANVNMGSSTYNKYNSIHTSNQLASTMQSSISYSKRWKNFNYTANLNHSQNTLDSTMTLTLPQMSFNMNRMYPFKRKNKIGKTRWYEKIGVSYNSNLKNTFTVHEDSIFNPLIYKNFKNGIKHSVPISASLKAFKHFTFNPSFAYTERWYLQTVERFWNDTANKADIRNINGFKRAGDYTVSAPLSTKLYGMYMLKHGPVRAIRHVITPTVSFSYRPDFSKDKWKYYYDYRTDTLGNTRQYSIFERGIYGGPPSGKYGSVNFNLGNNLETKVRNRKDTITGTKKIMLLESLSFNGSYNLAADSLNWSKFSVSGRTNILKFLNLTFNAVVDPYALNKNGVIVNKFVWDENKKIGRLTDVNVSSGFRFAPKQNTKKSKIKSEAFKSSLILAGLGEEYEDYYVDFNIPWTLSVNYSYRYSKPAFEKTITQTINFSGDVNLTGKWKIGYRSGYDLDKKDFTYTSIDIYRDLHCWEMSFNWIPYGFYKSYNFKINVKASILQDLKYNKRRSYTDNF